MLKNGKFWLVGVISLLLLTSGGLAASYYRQQVYQPLNPTSTEKISLVIIKGESGAEVAKRLRELGLIKTPLFFRIYLRLAGTYPGLVQAGEYELSPSLNLAQIVQKLSHGTFDIKLTFIEGWRKEQYAAFLAQKLGLDFTREFLADPQAKEGFLFPDTYLVNTQTQPSQLVSLLRANFDKKVDDSLRQAIEKQGLTLEQAVILASIVERETKFEKDRPLVAGILIKRLKNNWPLEADATVQYAKADQVCLTQPANQFGECDWWSKDLTNEDLQIDSPFNTRQVTGLPPAPIANPGLFALQAVAHPQESTDWYYLSDENGQIHYSQTLEQHNQKIVQYLGD